MTQDKLYIFKETVLTADRNIMFSKKGRKDFALRLSKTCGLWEPNVLSFVEEMAGLNFHILEDRNIFIQFAEVGL